MSNYVQWCGGPRVLDILVADCLSDDRHVVRLMSFDGRALRRAAVVRPGKPCSDRRMNTVERRRPLKQRDYRVLVFDHLCVASQPPRRAQSPAYGRLKDATGCVLPGVTVEASSAALWRESRTAVTDGRVSNFTDLRPGVRRTFTLTGSTRFVAPASS
jgi:hypothetical protein